MLHRIQATVAAVAAVVLAWLRLQIWMFIHPARMILTRPSSLVMVMHHHQQQQHRLQLDQQQYQNQHQLNMTMGRGAAWQEWSRLAIRRGCEHNKGRQKPKMLMMVIWMRSRRMSNHQQSIYLHPFLSPSLNDFIMMAFIPSFVG